MSKFLLDFFIEIIKISQNYTRPPKKKIKSKIFPISLSKNGEILPENNLLDLHWLCNLKVCFTFEGPIEGKNSVL
jgi:hypothetical protein